MAFDGRIRIDSSIDGKGFNKGISSMLGAVKGLAVAIGVAFGIQAAIDFGKTAVSAASDLASAMIGLQSVVEGTGNSFTKAKGFVNDYIKDGLVPITNATTAYKNLLMRGYDTTQIEKVLIALKDSASFGRQSSLSLGQAVQSATEGLKNENSILVDNAGVTKNVAMMWKDYAASIGTTVGALTKQQKIQAEVAGIMEESRFQTGDAAKLAGGYAGQVAALGTSFYNLKVAIGNSIIPIISKVMPYIKAAVDSLVVFFNRVAQFMSLLFGVQIGGAVDAVDSLAESTNAAADAQSNLADSTTKAGKAAKGALAPFDELNVLQMDEGEAAPGAESAATPGSIPGIGDPAVIDAGMDELEGKVEAFKESMLEFLKPVTDAFGRLGEALEPLGKTIWEGLAWAWENILVPLGTWTITEALPAFLNLLASMAKVVNEALIALQPGWMFFWDNILKPLAAWIGTAFINFLNWWAEGLDRVAEAFKRGGFKAAYIEAWNYISDTGREILGNLWNWIVEKWGQLSVWFSTNVTEPIRNAFNGALNWVSDKWKSTFYGIKDFVKQTINSIIALINGMISGVSTGINAVISALNTIKIDIPSILGAPAFSFGVNIPRVATPQIPMLATGAVIPANTPFAAILGDQRSGTNVEAPEDLIRSIIREEMGGQSAQRITIDFGNSSLGALIRALNPVIKQENDRIGSSLIDGATA